MPSSFDFLEAEFNNNTRNTFFSLAKMFLCVRALFEVSAFSANALSREGEKAAFRLVLFSE